MARKFSPQSITAWTNAVRTYNSMRTSYLRQNPGAWAPEKMDVRQGLAEAPNTQMLREMARQLKDFKHISDFAEADAGRKFKTAVGEERALKRLDRAEKKRIDKLIAEVNRQIPAEADTTKQMDLIYKKSMLQAKMPSLKGIQNRSSFKKITARYQRESAIYKKYKAVVVTDRYSLLAAMEHVGFGSTQAGTDVYNRIANMSEYEYLAFMAQHQNLDIDYVYMPNVSLATKINVWANALDVQIDTLAGDEVLDAEEDDAEI